jgi:DNA-binding CsgD family transcriptional regulator
MVVRVRDPERRRTPDPRVLQELFGLTPAEAGAVLEMVPPRSEDEAACRRGVAKSTFRAQLHAAYGKLGVNGRDELVHLLASYGFRQSGATVHHKLARCVATLLDEANNRPHLTLKDDVAAHRPASNGHPREPDRERRMAALRTFYQRIMDPGASRRGGRNANAWASSNFFVRPLGASIASFGLLCAAIPVVDAANFTCSWNDATANWTTAADWSNCNSTFPNNGAGSTYDATISTGDPTLTTTITIGSVTITGPGAWTVTGGGASATLTGLSRNAGVFELASGASLTTIGIPVSSPAQVSRREISGLSPQARAARPLL